VTEIKWIVLIWPHHLEAVLSHEMAVRIPKMTILVPKIAVFDKITTKAYIILPFVFTGTDDAGTWHTQIAPQSDYFHFLAT
jgi:hypothetical protein